MPMVLLKTVKSDKFSIDESNIEDALIEKPLEMKLSLLVSGFGYEIGLTLKGYKKGINICRFKLKDEDSANKIYNKVSKCIKRGNYKLSKTEINFGCLGLERELGRHDMLYIWPLNGKELEAKIPKATVVYKKVKLLNP